MSTLILYLKGLGLALRIIKGEFEKKKDPILSYAVFARRRQS